MPGVIGATCELGSATFAVTLLDVQPNAEFNLNTGYATLNLLLATDTPASLYDAGVLVAARLNAAPELAGQFVASVVVSGPTVQVVVTYTLAGANALILGSEDCGSAFDDSTGTAIEWTSPFGVTFAAPYPSSNTTAQANARFLCCPVPCAPEGMESYAEIRIWIECLSETPGTLSICQECQGPTFAAQPNATFWGIPQLFPPPTLDHDFFFPLTSPPPDGCDTSFEAVEIWKWDGAVWTNNPVDLQFQISDVSIEALAPFFYEVNLISPDPEILIVDSAHFVLLRLCTCCQPSRFVALRIFPGTPGDPPPAEWAWVEDPQWVTTPRPHVGPEEIGDPPYLMEACTPSVLECGDFIPVAPNPASTDAVIAQLQADYPTAIISREGLDLIVFRAPIEAEADCTAGWQVCASGEIVARVVQQPACCEPVEPCVPGIDYQPQASTSPVFTEGVGDIFDAVAVFYADCCAPVDGVVVLANEAAGVSLVGLPVVTPLGGNAYSVSQSVEYDGTPIAGDPGEQIDGGTLTFTVACGGADDTAIQIAAIIAEPEDPTPTCPITVVQATTATVSRTEFLAAVTHGIGTRITTPGCCALPTVSGIVTYEDIPGRLTINPIPVIQTLVANTSFYTVLNVQFDSSVVTGVAPPYPKLVGTVVVTITCGDSTITRTVNFYLLDPV